MNASQRILGRGWLNLLGHAGGLIGQGSAYWLAIYCSGVAKGVLRFRPIYPFFYEEERRIIWDVGDDFNVGLGWRS